jgi:glucose/arabinose dehydrogenase
MKLFLVLALVASATIVIYAFNKEPVFQDNSTSHNQTNAAQAVSNEVSTPEEIYLEDQTVRFKDGTETTFRLPASFSIAVAAEDVGKARFLTISPDKRLFVPNMVNFNDNTQGSIYILEDFNEETGAFETRNTYLTLLRNPNSIAFYTDDSNKQWIYIALTDKLIRYEYGAGDTSPRGEPQVITRFSDYRTVDNDVWHITRTILFQGDTLYVSVGSSCNLCEEPEDEFRSEILVMTPEGDNIQSYASGLRNAVGITWAEDALFATNNGPDHLGAEAPDDGMYHIVEGADFGFPYCYEVDGVVHEEVGRTWSREPVPCSSVPLFFASFGPHTAPLGLTYMEDGSPLLKGTFLAALHGSYRVEIGNGYSVIRITKDGKQDIFMDGFLKEDNERVGRPVHIVQRNNSSYFLSDDHNGRIYYLYEKNTP